MRTDVLASFNKDNPFSKAKKYSRTSHVRIYKHGLKHSTVEDVFSEEDIFSGVINKKGHLIPCFEESRIKGIGVHPLIFNDNMGIWKCNFWYSETLPQSHHSSVYKAVILFIKQTNNIITKKRYLLFVTWILALFIPIGQQIA